MYFLAQDAIGFANAVLPKSYDIHVGVASSIRRFHAQVHHQNTLLYMIRIQNKPAVRLLNVETRCEKHCSILDKVGF